MSMLKKVEISEIPNGRTLRKSLLAEIDEFFRSDWEAAEIDTSGYKSCKAAQGSWFRSVCDSGYNMTVTMRNGKLYIVKLTDRKEI